MHLRIGLSAAIGVQSLKTMASLTQHIICCMFITGCGQRIVCAIKIEFRVKVGRVSRVSVRIRVICQEY